MEIDTTHLRGGEDSVGMAAFGAFVIDQRDPESDRGKYHVAWSASAEELLETANCCLHLINYWLEPHASGPYSKLIKFLVMHEREVFLWAIDDARQIRDVDALRRAVEKFDKFICDIASARRATRGDNE